MSRIVGNRTIKRFLAEATAIGAALIVIAGTAENQVKLPTAADGGLIVGITLYAADAAGDPIEVVTAGVAELTAQAAITRGAPVSIQGVTGKAKTAAPAAGSNSFLVGFAAEAAAADGDLFACRIDFGVMQG